MSLRVACLDNDVARTGVVDLAILAHLLEQSLRVDVRVPCQDVRQLVGHCTSVDRQDVYATSEVGSSLELLGKRVECKAVPDELACTYIIG